MPKRSKGSRLAQIGLEEPLLGRLADFREAYFGAPEIRIIKEALEVFIDDRLGAEPEVKKRYDEARKRRMGAGRENIRVLPVGK